MTANDPTWAEALRARHADQRQAIDDLEDVVLIAELQRRMARDSGRRLSFEDVLRRLGITREELTEDEDE